MSPISDQEIEQIVGRVMSQLREGPPAPQNGASGHKTIALGADHGGFAMKEMLKAHLQAAGHTVLDCGTHSTESVDYPDFARAVAEKVAAKEACCGVIVDSGRLPAATLLASLPTSP